MYTRHDQSFKDEILAAIKNGAKVSDICAQRNLSSKTVYLWLRAQADNTGTSSLEVARLKRENQELKEIIGLFALEKKRTEKNMKNA
ncbi:MAG: transposase [Candidatus Magasanikbacteria bacterium]|nr:transposase [Candidatus Magasanikbacteria bacterium]